MQACFMIEGEGNHTSAIRLFSQSSPLFPVVACAVRDAKSDRGI